MAPFFDARMVARFLRGSAAVVASGTFLRDSLCVTAAPDWSPVDPLSGRGDTFGSRCTSTTLTVVPLHTSRSFRTVSGNATCIAALIQATPNPAACTSRDTPNVHRNSRSEADMGSRLPQPQIAGTSEYISSPTTPRFDRTTTRKSFPAPRPDPQAAHVSTARTQDRLPPSRPEITPMPTKYETRRLAKTVNCPRI